MATFLSSKEAYLDRTPTYSLLHQAVKLHSQSQDDLQEGKEPILCSKHVAKSWVKMNDSLGECLLAYKDSSRNLDSSLLGISSKQLRIS